jgi:hypothetical protein
VLFGGVDEVICDNLIFFAGGSDFWESFGEPLGRFSPRLSPPLCVGIVAAAVPIAVLGLAPVPIPVFVAAVSGGVTVGLCDVRVLDLCVESLV